MPCSCKWPGATLKGWRMTGSKKDFRAADITKPFRIKLGDRWRTSKESDLPGLTSLFCTAVLEWVLQPALSYPWKCIFLVEISLFASEAISSVIPILHDFPAWPAAISICLCETEPHCICVPRGGEKHRASMCLVLNV